MRPEAPLTRIAAQAFTIPTDRPEADGTMDWDSTTLIVATAMAGGRAGTGYGYADATAAHLIAGRLWERLCGIDAMDINRAWTVMTGVVRNLGRPGIAPAAISAVDAALWDLKGRLLEMSVADLLGRARDGTPSTAASASACTRGTRWTGTAASCTTPPTSW